MLYTAFMKKLSKIPILYEDDYLFAVNKPARVMSVPADLNPRSRAKPTKSVLEVIRERFQHTGNVPYLLHRLDMNTSGVLLFGKNKKDREALEGIFKDERTKKIYITLLKGVPRSGMIKHALLGRYKGKQVEDAAEIQKKTALTEFKVFKTVYAAKQKCALTEVKILTGRKHQIRQHFANIGFPVVMDDQYGDKFFNRKFRIKYWLGRQFLHAQKIEFFHPLLKKTIAIEVPMAMDLQQVLKRIISVKHR